MVKQTNVQTTASPDLHIIVGRLATDDKNIFLDVPKSLHEMDGLNFIQVGDHF